MDRRSCAPGEGPNKPRRQGCGSCGGTVGHVPFNVAPVVSDFLKRSSNKALAVAEVTESAVNQGAAYGLEIV